MTRHVLAGDIGGTKTNLAIYALDESLKLSLVRESSYPSKQYAALEEILREFLEAGREEPEAGGFGIAGPVAEDVVVPTNLPWKTIEAANIAREIGCERVRLLNDLATTAYGALFLPPDQLHTLNQGKQRQGNAAVIAAGTGLGQAMLFWDGERYIPSSTEGGHIDFAPRNQVEIELLQFLLQELPRVTYERVLSGPGMFNIFRFLDAGLKRPVNPAVRQRLEKEDPGAVVGQAALEGTCPTCAEALDIFVSIYGAQAGNLALTFMSTGGLYIGGGIIARILPKVTAGAFMESFHSKQPFADLMTEIPVHVILNPKASQLGAARAAAELVKRGNGS